VASLSASTEIAIPAGAMVVLVGPSGSGKTTFAARHFPRTHVLSSDEMRAIVADDANDQAATSAAFELLHTALALRLARGRTTVVDATNVERWARGRLLAVARRSGRPAVAVVFALPLETCLARNLSRADQRPATTIRRQHRWMSESLRQLGDEEFAAVHVLEGEKAVARALVAIG
jgi:protein phosphatase